MTLETWLAFVAASTILLVIPGPTILAVISYAVSHGARATLALVSAVALGDATAVFASMVGLGALMAASAFWFTVVKVIGGLYLLYLGVKLLRSGVSPVTVAATSQPTSLRRLFTSTYVVTALNPKGIVFFIAFLPQFVTPGPGSTGQLWLLGTTFVVLGALNAAVYALFASSARRLLTSGRAQRWFNVTGGSLLTSAGIWALLARRPV
ncbi:LysE family translocator [Marinobacter nanhaiticus D15-8W]|uniref:LysE family translocator n=1 Tax=Marinobacter nanhaiticus D15-8W TaxID=626887 RepID=N6W5U6_9GAMM|nr:LysE family translocator [Marinobacter nanhaiticus]ENO15579.1 LysE family translocator [Marinobacter nanhaiticus D15-8W]BES73571.1 LysE family translocator [Marinobacter nanhaiticus D15-8W]